MEPQTYMKRLSATLHLKLLEGNRDSVFFVRRKLEDATNRLIEIKKGFMQMILRHSEEISTAFLTGDQDYCVISNRNEGHTRFYKDTYNNVILWIRPRNAVNNFNMTRLEFSNLIRWKPLLIEYFTLVS